LFCFRRRLSHTDKAFRVKVNYLGLTQERK
jgi:hypothetical protein